MSQLVEQVDFVMPQAAAESASHPPREVL